RTGCLLPLHGKSGLVGVLALLSQKPASAFRPEIPALEYYAAHTALAIGNSRLYGQVQEMFISSITALAAAVDAKDAYTHGHSEGHGYPNGLRGSEIPIGSAILAVAEAFDAMTSQRAYHAARPVDAALEELQGHAGTQFHPQVVDALARIVARERDTGSPWF